MKLLSQLLIFAGIFALVFASSDVFGVEPDTLTEAETRAMIDAELNEVPAPVEDASKYNAGSRDLDSSSEEEEEDTPLSAVSVTDKVEDKVAAHGDSHGSDSHGSASSASSSSASSSSASASSSSSSSAAAAPAAALAEHGSTSAQGGLANTGSITGPQEGDHGADRRVSEEPFKGTPAGTHPAVHIPEVDSTGVVNSGNCPQTDAFGNCVLRDADPAADPRMAGKNIKCAQGNPLCCAACKTTVGSLFDFEHLVRSNNVDRLCTLVPAEQQVMCREFMSRSRTDGPNGCKTNGECLVRLMAARAPPTKTCVEAGVCLAPGKDAPLEEMLDVLTELSPEDEAAMAPLPADAELDDPDVLVAEWSSEEGSNPQDWANAQVVENSRGTLQDPAFDDIPDNSDLLVGAETDFKIDL
jgi:hypothetical protein